MFLERVSINNHDFHSASSSNTNRMERMLFSMEKQENLCGPRASCNCSKTEIPTLPPLRPSPPRKQQQHRHRNYHNAIKTTHFTPITFPLPSPPHPTKAPQPDPFFLLCLPLEPPKPPRTPHYRLPFAALG